MQATSPTMAMPARYGAPLSIAPVSLAISLGLARLRLPPAWRPALLASLHLLMGTWLGGMLGAAAGHGLFWAIIGTGLGAALQAIAPRG